MTTTRRVGWVGFALTATLISLITLTPQSSTSAHGAIARSLLRALHRIGVPPSFGDAAWEVTANVIMFIPLGFFLILAVPPTRTRVAWLALPLISLGIETSQYLFLPSRYPTISDLLANTAGGWLGVLLGLVLLRFLSRTRAKRAGHPNTVPTDSQPH